MAETENDIAARRGSEEVWLQAAHRLLVEQGVDAVKIMPLAKQLGLSRTSFYWHFADREQLLAALVQRWRQKNTGNLVAQTELYAESISEAVFNLFDCWIDDALFDARLDFAIRHWAKSAPDLMATLKETDEERIRAIVAMFHRFDYPNWEAAARGRTIYYAQTGYIAMMLLEPLADRLRRMPRYVEIYTGRAPTKAETARFNARHAKRARRG